MQILLKCKGSEGECQNGFEIYEEYYSKETRER
jgi:hypothetical protein